MNDLFKTLEVSSIFSAIKRACKWQHDCYYWDSNIEWAWIKDELYKCDSKIEQLNQEKEKLKEQLKYAKITIINGANIRSYSDSVGHIRECEGYLNTYKKEENE